MKKSKKKVIIAVILAVFVLMIAAWWIFCVRMYDANMNVSEDSYEPLMLKTEDYEAL